MVSYPICKINIGLYVTGKRPDGYHNLQTVFYPIPLTDNLEVIDLTLSDAPYVLHTTGAAVAGAPEQNLVVRALMLLREEFDLPGVEIWLHKRIPSGAGLGGGSSDAAYMMKALRDLYQLPLTDHDLEARLSTLGADCPFFVKATAQYAEGIGELLSPCSVDLHGWHLLLVKPDIFVSTREAFAGICPAIPAYDLRTAISAPVEQWHDRIFNDFERTVFAAHPAIGAIKQTLYDMGATYAAMTGSGSSVFGLFRRPADEAKSVFADCFTFQCRL